MSSYEFRQFSPLMPDVGIAALVPDEWRGPWQSRHWVLTKLSQYFHVLWINPPYEWRQVVFPAQRRHRANTPSQEVSPGFTVYSSSRLLPVFYRPKALANITERTRFDHARRILDDKGCTHRVVYLWRPDYAAALDRLDYDLSLYHIDDEYTFSSQDMPIDPIEADIIRRVDRVIIHSPALFEKKGYINPNSEMISNGVCFDSYADPHEEPEDLASVPHPRVGYVGIVKKQLDFEIPYKLAVQHPEWSWVYVGPLGNLGTDSPMVSRLFDLPNVYFLGQKDVTELPAYMQHLDICFMCYKQDDYTKYIYPLKIHEYLATGRPVVGTPIRSLRDFSEYIALPSTIDGWESAISDMLNGTHNTPNSMNARQQVARRHDWDTLVGRIARSICAGLGDSFVERLDKVSSPTQG